MKNLWERLRRGKESLDDGVHDVEPSEEDLLGVGAMVPGDMKRISERYASVYVAQPSDSYDK